VAKNLTKQFDALVVGGGIIGLLTARNLQNEGLRVAIFEQGKLGGAATWAAGGILSALNPWQQNLATQVLADEGRDHFAILADELKHETKIDPEFIQSGMLVLDTEEKQQAFCWAKKNNQIVDILYKNELQKQEVNLSRQYEEALYLPNISQIRPPRLIAALQQSLLQKNVKIYENTPVEKFLIKENNVTGISTINDTFHAQKVIVCSGAWTKDLLKKEICVDIKPVRGQMLLYKLSKQILSHIILNQGSYIIPRQDGHLLCGSTVEHVGFENEVTPQARQELQTIAQQLVPLLAEHEPIKQWSALRPGTQRDKPYICEHPIITGLYLNSGHYRYGILMSIASARIMTELVTNSLPMSQIDSFAS